nr:hypothetical protein BaRGS_004827 [Batillaria attramentaria]
MDMRGPTQPRFMSRTQILPNIDGVLPKRHDSLKLKVTFETSGHVLDLDLKPSKLSHDGAKVVVRYGEEKKEYVWRDKGCHYHGTFNEERGEASVHFCHGVVIGGAHLEDMEYYIHPHPDDIIDHDDHSDIPDDHIEHYPGLTDDAIDTGAGSRVVVTWKKPDPLPFQTEDAPTSDAAITRRRRQASGSGPEITDAESADPDFDETEEEQQEPIEPEKKADKHVNPDFDPNQPIVVEFALVMDERYLKLIANRHHYTDDEHFINFAITKYTGPGSEPKSDNLAYRHTVAGEDLRLS